MCRILPAVALAALFLAGPARAGDPAAAWAWALAHPATAAPAAVEKSPASAAWAWALCRVGDEPVCPVFGSLCPCGCLGGKACNCAADSVSIGGGPSGPQREAYDALVRRLKPGSRFQVFVGANTDTRGTPAIPSVRWDGCPGTPGRWVIHCRIMSNGDPWEFGRSSLDPPPTQPFGGSCPGGKCRPR